jgi:tetratricopeptide (TPR) repeat protein
LEKPSGVALDISPPKTESIDAGILRQLIKTLDKKKTVSPSEEDEILDTLEKFECWEPFFRLTKKSIASGSRTLRTFVRVAKVQSLYLEDVFAATDTCCQLIKDLKPDYQTFRENVLPTILQDQDYAAEATILSGTLESFGHKGDQVAILERLCMLYEKKIHNETELNSSYEKLLDSDPTNLKALRYFKLVFTQNNDWNEVIEILKTMLNCVAFPQETYRVAQELSAIYLYQMDQAEKAIEILSAHCEESPLDTSTIKFDAYSRTGDWGACLKVLRESLLACDDDISRSILLYKTGLLHENLDDTQSATEEFKKAVELWPTFIEAYEHLILLAIKLKNWREILHYLAHLEEITHDNELAGQIKQAFRRLQDGISSVSTY